ncbi:UDP-N-acetylmuramate--L-alanine ligase [Nocardioides sp. R-C-SC26]|uniref:UDP-N-acetylmuramate--L-alanine ligase n=1 Tax=Nocardioides sp. R-C-SC26 TaxID=2870414 RepID=UPI001E6473F6|nr:UDP-N-acetylmuramate--L-alanine ligase [Nocardioides sp. R-C-SC26]
MKVPVPERIPELAELGRVHIVGIGGAGMSGIARIMAARGVDVDGCDSSPQSERDAALIDAGVRQVWTGHDGEHAESADTVVFSTAAREDNPDYLRAAELGRRVLPRSAALASLMRGYRVLAVAGTHGKTTTTSLLTVALQSAGADPTYAIGGDLTATGVNAAAGSGELFVVEADESDGAFLVYEPFGAIVTNVDADHLDQWGTEEAYRAAFDAFADRIDPAGFLVCCIDDAGGAALAERSRAAGRRVITVSTDAGSGADVTPEALAGVTLWAPGDHYLADALAAYAAGLAVGLPGDALRAGLAGYTGTRRRMEPKGEAAGVRVYDSYAHHPTEILGDLQTARALAGEGRVVVAFQPHLVSRTRIFGEQMGAALSAADEVVVLDIYLAREEADPAVTPRLITDAVRLAPERVGTASLEDAAAVLVGRARPGDLVLTLGAGTVTQVGPQVLDLLAARSPRVASAAPTEGAARP